MAVTASTLRKLAALDLSPEQMAGVLEVLAEGLAADEARKAGQAERKRRSRAKERDGHVTVTGQDCDPSSLPASDKENPPAPPKEINSTQPSNHGGHARFANPAIVLQSILDPMTAKQFVDHLAQKRKPLSAPAAEELVATLREVRALGGNPVEAIRLANRRNWVSLEIGYLRSAGMKLADKPKATGSVLEMTPERWKQALQFCRERRAWDVVFGPAPFEDGCRVPADMLLDSDRNLAKAVA
jgi:hypothetical protein